MLERLEDGNQRTRGIDMWQQGRVRLAQVIVVGVFAVYAQGAYAQVGSQAPNAQPNPYRTIENPLTLPEGREMGWVMGVEVDRNNGDVWLFDTCGGGLQDCVESSVPPIVRFDSSGRFITSFGSGMFAHPHGLYIDSEGNIWVIDGYGGNTPPDPRGHQVLKFSPDGRLLMTLGTAGVRGDGPDTFNTPSDVLVAPNGDIFVADGHGGDMNDRIVKFTREGSSSRHGARKARARASSTTPTLLPWIPKAACSSVTEPIFGSRSSIRTDSSWMSGGSSARRAKCSSTRTTLSMSPTRYPASERTRAGKEVSGSGTPRMAR